MRSPSSEVRDDGRPRERTAWAVFGMGEAVDPAAPEMGSPAADIDKLLRRGVARPNSHQDKQLWEIKLRCSA